MNAETQTEGITHTEQEKYEQKATTTREQSVQTECEEVRNETWKDEADISSRGGVTPPPTSTPTLIQSIEPATRTLSPQPNTVIVLPAEVEERNLPHQSAAAGCKTDSRVTVHSHSQNSDQVDNSFLQCVTSELLYLSLPSCTALPCIQIVLLRILIQF